MDYGRLLTTSWQITWRHKFLWPLGCVLALDALVTALLTLSNGQDTSDSAATRLRQWQAQPELLMQQLEAWIDRVNERLLSSGLIYFFTLLIIWLVTTLALALIINTAIHASQQKPLLFTDIWRDSWQLLLRFIAIDTIIYFPLFLVILMMMLIVLGTLIGITVTAWQPEATPAALIRPLLTGLICAFPVFCLIFPITLFTALFRTVALRETAVHHTAIRLTIRRTWSTLKSNAGAIILLALLLWSTQFALNLLLDLAGNVLYSFSTPPGILALLRGTASAAPTTHIWQLVSFLFEGTHLLIQAIAQAFTAVAWTLAYQEISYQYSVNSSQSPTDH